MRDECNAQLKKLKESGQYDKIMDRYFKREALKSDT
jgi:ABC-type amino acid transport substrate-binding protein